MVYQMNLYKASSQWSSRPADERFESVEALHNAVSGYRADARTAKVDLAKLRVEAQAGEVTVIGKMNEPATLTHFAFGQFAREVGAPTDYLRGLPATLAAQNINHGLSKLSDRPSELLIHQNGSKVLRGFNSLRYTRIWNSDVTSRVLQLDGWKLPPARPVLPGQPGSRPATAADVLASTKIGGLSIEVGDTIAPAGAYGSDHDVFVFMVNENRMISEPGNPGGLARGFFVWNQEVPGVSFGVMTFLYRTVCGNHIVWGAENVHEVRIRHTGNADVSAFRELSVELLKYADESASEDEARIVSARSFNLGATKDDVLDLVFGKKLGLSRTVLDTAYQLADANSDTDGSPRSAWGLAQGLTRYSQTVPYADERTKLDRAAGRIIEIAF